MSRLLSAACCLRNSLMLALVFTFGVLAPSARACPQDWNTSGTLDADDLFAFIDDWFLGVADFNRDRLTDADDLFAYMDAYFAGCENGSDNGLTGMYLQPEVEGGVAALAGVLGVRTYLSDIILLTPGAGTELEIRLLNSYTQGETGVLGIAELESTVGESQEIVTQTVAGTVRSRMAANVFHVTTAVGTGYLGAVGVEAYWTCNLEIEDFAMGMMPVSVAATAEGATTPALTKTAAACATVVDPCNPADDPRLRADCMLPDNQMSCVTRVNCQYDTQRFDALCAYLRAIDDCSTTALDRTGETVILTGVGLCAGGLPGAIAFSRGLGLRRFPIGTAWLAPRPPSKTCGQSLNSGVRLICNGTANNDQ